MHQLTAPIEQTTVLLQTWADGAPAARGDPPLTGEAVSEARPAWRRAHPAPPGALTRIVVDVPPGPNESLLSYIHRTGVRTGWRFSADECNALLRIWDRFATPHCPLRQEPSTGVPPGRPFRPIAPDVEPALMRVWNWRTAPAGADEDREAAMHRVCAAIVRGHPHLSLAGLRLRGTPPLESCLQLRTLDLSGNRLTALPMLSAPQLLLVDLSRNPWPQRPPPMLGAVSVIAGPPRAGDRSRSDRAPVLRRFARVFSCRTRETPIPAIPNLLEERLARASESVVESPVRTLDAVIVHDLREAPAQERKPEPGRLRQAAAAACWVEVALDQARSAFFEELGQYCDLTGDGPQWQSTLADRPACVLHHPMAPDPAMDDAFPWRDPENPHRVHRRYADAAGRVSPWTSVGPVRWMPAMDAHFWTLAERDETLRTRALSAPERRQLREALAQDVHDELARLIAGRPRTPRCHVRRLRPEELPAHEQPLAGQQGLFVDGADEPGQRHTATRGRILGLYMGMLLESEDEEAAHLQRYPGGNAYLLDVRRPGGRLIGLAGLGAANAAVFANTSLLPGEPARYDKERLNASFVAFDVRMTDGRGRAVRETAVALVAFDALYGPLHPRREVRVDYGDDYLRHFAGGSVQGATACDIKQEPGPE